MENNRIKEVCKIKGISFIELSQKLGLKQYQTLTSRTKNPTLKSLQEIADVLECEVVELLPVGPEYSHFYDQLNNEWLGIRKK